MTSRALATPLATPLARPLATAAVSPSLQRAIDTLADRPVPSLPRPQPPLDLAIAHRLHVVGVGGPGMSAVAIALAEMGHVVSGSDLREDPVLERVRTAGVDVHIGHDRALVRGVDAVTASTAIPGDNIELDEARSIGVTVLRRAGMLASICARAQSLAVAGTHGKTTTTSMLMLMLAQAGMRPSFVVGGDVTDVGTGAQWTHGDWLVVEADESDGTHLELPLFGTILTNVEADHLDHYGSFDGIVSGFDAYLGQIEGPKVICGDDPIGVELAARHGGLTYGLDAACDVRAVDVRATSGSFRFDLVYQPRLREDSGGTGHLNPHANGKLGEIVLPLRGIHNVVNATGAAAMALAVGVSFDDIAAALARFGGVARRFDVRGTDGGATLVDDYAHLPSEIDAVIRAARDSGDAWRRVVAVFQPNRYHRIAEMWREYASAFTAADLVVLTDIYASGTVPIPGVTGKLIVNAVTEADPTRRVVWLPRREDLVSFLANELRDGDVCISMGCGDIATLPSEVLDVRRR
ncbi:MAG TPA: UDP-N-acetylmuramate--L-alanine ligase [Ilumatobacteraceae bacterium]|nr:UDP-N-acetylmuramate--L-alanine ligase [Ilumatobacteraceae bacterium]